MVPELVYTALNPRPKTELSDLGRFHAHRTVGLPMADRSQRPARPLGSSFFIITTTEVPATVQAPEIPNQPAAAAKPEGRIRNLALENQCRNRIPKTGPDERSKTSAENLGRYKSGHPDPRVFFPRTTIVGQQATRRFDKWSMCQQRVLHCWQRCQLFGGHDIPRRLLPLLETVHLDCGLSSTEAASGNQEKISSASKMPFR
jgi:hypothetical protein